LHDLSLHFLTFISLQLLFILQLAVKTVVPHDAVLDGSSPPPRQLAEHEPAPFRTPNGLLNSSDLASTGNEQATGASKARKKPTPASAPKGKSAVAKQTKKKAKEEGGKEFTQRKLHEMKGLTPISKKSTIKAPPPNRVEGTGEAEVSPAIPPRAAQPVNVPAAIPSRPNPIPDWKTFVPSNTPRPQPAPVFAFPGAVATAATTFQSPPSVVSKTWKSLSPNPAANLAVPHRASAVPSKPMPLAPRELGFATSASRPPPQAAPMAGKKEKVTTTPLPSFGQFAFNAKQTSVPVVQHKDSSKNIAADVENTNQVLKQQPLSRGPSTTAAPASIDVGGTAAGLPQKKQRIKVANTSSSLNWLSTKFKTASAVRNENAENQT
jgi:hypothetical protein